MLYIRKEQMGAFQEEAERKYRERLCAVVPDAWPSLAGVLGDKGVKAWVEKGFRKAKSYGFKDYDNIARFVHLMFMLTDDEFDKSPETPWAEKILGWKNAPEGMLIAALEKKARGD